jgi:hypothetical protein
MEKSNAPFGSTTPATTGNMKGIPMPRYDVNHVAVFIRADFDGPVTFGNLYIPWMHSNLRLTVLCMTVAEHHKVTWRYDHPGCDPLYDGYVLRDTNGEVWHNQYPVADYGQLDDSNNWKVHKAEGDDPFHAMQDVTKFLDTIYRGLDSKDAFTPEQRVMMKEYLALVIQTVEERVTATVARRPIIMERKDGTKSVHDVFETVLVPLEESTTPFTRSQLHDTHGLTEREIDNGLRIARLRMRLVNKIENHPEDGPHFAELSGDPRDMYIRTVALGTAKSYAKLKRAPVGSRRYEVVCRYKPNTPPFLHEYFSDNKDAQMVHDLVNGIAGHPVAIMEWSC